MKFFTPLNTFLAMCLLLLSFSLSAQTSNSAAYHAAVQAAINSGNFEGLECGMSSKDQASTAERLACAPLTDGFGTNSWLPTSSPGTNNVDPACTVPNTPYPSDNGGLYRVPLRIVIFECSTWTGDNYTNGTNFLALQDVDIDAKLAEVNTFYEDAKIEFYQVERLRVENCDLYDYYRNNTDPSDAINNGVDDLGETAAYDIDNVINLYFVGGLDGSHNCCGTMGFAPYPASREYSVMRYGAGVGGSTLSHELGHFFGLYHTHKTTPNFSTGDNNGTASGALDNSDCLTSGDGICDTWPDPRFSFTCGTTCIGSGVDNYCYISDVFPRCDFDMTGYTCENGSALTINPGLGTDISATQSTILEQNIMSYNFYSSCRVRFSPCQMNKVNEVLTNTGCRDDLCYTDASSLFASTAVNNVSSPNWEICIGESIPTLSPGKTITKFDGTTYNLDKFFFYANESDLLASALNGTPAASYTPTAAQVDVNTPGVYSIWVSEINTYASSPCKVQATITVLPNSGDATPVALAASGSTTVNLATAGTTLDNDQIIGWWVRSTTTVSGGSFADQAALDAALATATNGGTIMDNPDNIFASTTGSPATDFSLAMDCNTLDNGVTYYATPFISNSVAGVADASCTETSIDSGITVSSNAGRRSRFMPGSITCAPASPNTPTFTLSINITAYTGAANNLSLRVRNSTCSTPSIIFATAAGIGTYTYTEANFPAGYDPNVSGFCILAYELGSGSAGSGIAMNAALDITYPGTPAVVFPDVALNDCAFGNPIAISCSAALPVELLSFRGEQNGAQADLFWHTANEQNNDFFTLEKADENGIFREIAVVKGAGTTDEDQYYSEIDARPHAGQNLYRLKQTDFDGKTTTSAVITINFKADELVDFFPNPVKGGAFTLQYQTEKNAGQAQLEIFALNGQKLYTQTLAVEAGVNRYEIRVNDLAKGVYLARIINGTSVHTFKLTNVK